eukprot:4432575-Amphidinium_carterae.1
MGNAVLQHPRSWNQAMYLLPPSGYASHAICLATAHQAAALQLGCRFWCQACPTNFVHLLVILLASQTGYGYRVFKKRHLT